MKKLISILSLPRSGSTMLTAIFDSHPDIECWYEIYGSRDNSEMPVYKDFSELFNDFLKNHGYIYKNHLIKKKHFWNDIFKKEHCPPSNYPFNFFVIKETRTFPSGIQSVSGIEYVDSILENISKSDPIEIENIWLYRDFRHVFLSRIEGMKKWWGDPDAQATKESYITWINEAFEELKIIQNVSLKYNTIIVNYDNFVKKYEENISNLLNYMEIPFSENVLHFQNVIKLKKVKGDLNVSTNPKHPNVDSINKREKEWAEFSNTIYPLPESVSQVEKYLLKFQQEVSKSAFQKLTKKLI